MMDYKESEGARENVDKFIDKIQHKIKALARKLERILIKLYRHVSL